MLILSFKTNINVSISNCFVKSIAMILSIVIILIFTEKSSIHMTLVCVFVKKYF